MMFLMELCCCSELDNGKNVELIPCKEIKNKKNIVNAQLTHSIVFEAFNLKGRIS
jgi:hypothetical protein